MYSSVMQGHWPENEKNKETEYKVMAGLCLSNLMTRKPG